MATYGYVRVSTKEQNEARQNLALCAHGVPAERIFMDKQSGKDFDRPAYQQLLRRLRPGDLLCIKSIDRLGRDYTEIQEQWRHITRDKGADIVVLDMPLLDTRKGKDLLGTFVSDMVLQVLSFVAENERTNIRQRQAEGIKAERLAGKHLGRPSKPLPPLYGAAVDKYRSGELNMRQAAIYCGMPCGSFRYHVLKEGQET